jgi:hypothetical protein
MSVVSGVAQISPGGPTLHRPPSGQDEIFDLEDLLSGRDSSRPEVSGQKSAPVQVEEAVATVTPAQAREILRQVTEAARAATPDTLAGWHNIGRPSLLGSAYI